MLHRTVIIYNSTARRLSREKEFVSIATRLLEAAGHTVSSVPTLSPCNGGAIAKEQIAAGAELIVVAGGDGTVNDVMQGMIGSTAALGVLPGGTANVLANEIGLASDVETATRRLIQSVAQRISVGRLHFLDGEFRYFLLMAGIGLDAHVVYNLSLPLKAKLGKLAYWLGGLSMIGRSFPEFGVRWGENGNSGDATCSFALVSKVRNYGGDLEIARNSCLFDDHFEVVLFTGRSSLHYLKYFAGVASRRLSGMKGITIVRSRKLCFPPAQDERVYIQVDGESAGRLPCEIEIVPDALTLLIPAGYSLPSPG